MSHRHETTTICECNGKNQHTYEEIIEITNYLKQRVTIQPVIGIICGTGLGPIADILNERTTFNYSDIPKFPVSTVTGHAGKLHFGLIDSIPVVCMQGRFHPYEGNPLWKCVIPVRIFKLLGVTHLIASNAAGGLNPDFQVGDIMLIKDHINFLGLAGNNPLCGPNDPRFGPRFVSMTRAYDQEILRKARSVAMHLGFESFLREGVYACLGGPNFETIAECKMLSIVGVDAVGMSTVHEVMAAKQIGLKCFAFSLITNKCVVDYESLDEPDSDEVVEEGRKRGKDLQDFIRNVVNSLL